MKCAVVYLDFSLNNHMVKIKQRRHKCFIRNRRPCGRATTAQLHPGWDTFEIDQGHVTKNQPITMLILLSESIGI